MYKLADGSRVALTMQAFKPLFPARYRQHQYSNIRSSPYRHAATNGQWYGIAGISSRSVAGFIAQCDFSSWRQKAAVPYDDQDLDGWRRAAERDAPGAVVGPISGG